MYSKEEMIKENFHKMREDNEIRTVRKWFSHQKYDTRSQKQLLDWVKEGLFNIHYSYRVQDVEASIKDGRVFFQPGEKVAVDRDWGLDYFEMEQKVNAFAPERYSGIATIHEAAVWYAYRIAQGYWTIEDVCDNSSLLGNFADAPNASHTLERSGCRVTGGARDGVGNTFKCVTLGFKYLLLAGDFTKTGINHPVAVPWANNYRYSDTCKGSPIVVLRK